jgi:PAS domain S-box-containing protein
MARPDEFNWILWRFMLGIAAQRRGRQARITALVCAVLVLSGGMEAQTRPTRRVLILYETGTWYPAINTIDQGIRAGLQDAPYRLEFYREYMETVLFPDPETQQEFRNFYLRKYQNRKPDVIIAVGPSPLQFILKTHESAFAGIPVIFCLPYGPLPNTLTLDPGITGVTNVVEPAATLEVALRLKPETKHVIIVGGTSTLDRQTEAMIQQGLRGYADRLDISYLTNLTMPALLTRLRHVPNDAIILFIGVTQDAAGTPFIGSESAAAVTAAASAPVFVLTDSFLGHGEVGGELFTRFEQGKITGNMSLRVLTGEKPQDIPAVNGVTQYMFDWRALKRWGLKESNLPPGSILLNRQRSFWELYGQYVLVGLFLLLVQSILILALLIQRTKRKRSEKSLLWRLEFEGLLSDLSRKFIGLPEEEVDVNIEHGLARVGTFLEMDRVTLFEFSQDRTKLSPTYGWNGPGAKGAPPLTTGAVPWWEAQTLRGEACLTTRLDDLPEEASAEKAYLLQRGVVSAASIPLKVGGQINGVIVFLTESREVFWTEDLVKQLRVIGDVFWNALKRKRAREALLASQALVREREERFQFVANAAPVTIWMTDVDSNCTYVNQGWLDFTGRSLESQLGKGWTEQIHPEDLTRSLERIEKASVQREPVQSEYRVRRHDGEYRWMLASGVPRFDTHGSFAGHIGSAIDITERKLAEGVLSTVSQKLIDAQEQERTRIARELHDNINQRIAFLAISLESLKENLPAGAVESMRQIVEAVEEVTDIGKDIQGMSHRLYSSKLDLLGLEAAAASFCKEVSNRHSVDINFRSENVPRELPNEVSLSLFRVLQEALQNAIKYSGSRHFRVSLNGAAKKLELTVQDSGIGFEPEVAIKGHGLGLTSMRERLRLVDGELSIDSKPQQGTTVRARVGLVHGAKVRTDRIASSQRECERIAGPVKVLVIEDYDPFRRFVCAALQRRAAEFDVTQASDGLEAVQKAVTLEPDLILLDIGLPKLDGFQVAKRIGSLVPRARILFVSQESSSEVIREALRVGGRGYVQKSRAHGDLLAAVDAVLGDKRFVSSGLEFGDTTSAQTALRHERLFCSNDAIPKLVLAEDHPAMRETIVKILHSDFDVVASVETGLAALEATNKLNPDVLVIDVRMQALDGTDVVKRLKGRGNKAKIVFVSASMDATQVSSCLAAGGHAYVSKIRMATDLPAAIRKVLVGEGFVSAA